MIRTGDIRGEMHLWMVYLSQCLNGLSLALLTTTTFPEIIDNAEQSEFYPLYNKEQLNLWVSGAFVLWTSIANAMGTFLGSVAAQAIGYSWAFFSAGCFLVFITIVYALVCGTGNMTDEPLQTLPVKEPKQADEPRNSTLELSVRDSVKSSKSKNKL